MLFWRQAALLLDGAGLGQRELVLTLAQGDVAAVPFENGFCLCTMAALPLLDQNGAVLHDFYAVKNNGFSGDFSVLITIKMVASRTR